MIANMVLFSVVCTCFLSDGLGYEQKNDERVGIKLVKGFHKETA